MGTHEDGNDCFAPRNKAGHLTRSLPADEVFVKSRGSSGRLANPVHFVATLPFSFHQKDMPGYVFMNTLSTAIHNRKKLYIICPFEKLNRRFMKWVLHNTMNLSHFWSLQENDSRAELRYNKESHSLRLNASDRRLYFMDRTGLFQSKVIFKTEYSVLVGECFFIRNREAGILVLDGEKFNFNIHGDHLQVLNRDKKMILDSCIDEMEQLDLYEFSALLFATVRIRLRQGTMERLSA